MARFLNEAPEVGSPTGPRPGPVLVRWLGLGAGLLTVFCWVGSIPPFGFAEAAYVGFVPLLLWLGLRPGWRETLLIGFLTGWASWFSMLIWLRHVTWIGTAALAALLGLLFLGWVALARWQVPRLVERSFAVRFLGFCGLAGAWVLIEWVRSWLFWGFPWAPLALSQWERPVVLQIAAWSGAYGVSFLLVFFNCCAAQTLRQRILVRERKLWSGWFSPDLYLGLGALGFCVAVFFKTLPEKGTAEALFTAGVVQPYIPPSLKWDDAKARQNLEILEKQTAFVASLESDLLLWPEAATPLPILGHAGQQERTEAMVRRLGKPLLMGNLSADWDSDIWGNGIFLATPEAGLADGYYLKRELVPFGEYVPTPFGFIEKVVPVGGRFTPGSGPALIPLELGERVLDIGGLVCYEDVFPRLARESVLAGADVLFVATNNAWYGEEGGAVQHAAHSVLRAVENRRPVMRCGNGGWSGWIDAYGTVRDVLRDGGGSIFFRGGGNYTVAHFEGWRSQRSFYTRHGDWFVAISAALVIVGGISARRGGGPGRQRAPKATGWRIAEAVRAR